GDGFNIPKAMKILSSWLSGENLIIHFILHIRSLFVENSVVVNSHRFTDQAASVRDLIEKSLKLITPAVPPPIVPTRFIARQVEPCNLWINNNRKEKNGDQTGPYQNRD
ncbi:MAG: hypothetical protein MI862_13480, partial [Desulfobacterales bacterium]|nr:hypothetical protein [Desulfobacterales bacterium]